MHYRPHIEFLSIRLALAGLHPLEASAIDDTVGFVVELGQIQLATSASGFVDLNQDGFDEIAFGLPLAASDEQADSGRAIALLGRPAAFSSPVDAGSLGTRAVRIVEGAVADGQLGAGVSGIADFNDDGIDDLIVGAKGATFGRQSGTGAAYLVFGSKDTLENVLSVADLDGGNGFRFEGVDEGDGAGNSVSGAGDVNGDGLADLIIAAKDADSSDGEPKAGESYVVFGSASEFEASFQLSSLDGTNGFTIEGSSQNEQSGYSVSSAGDVNGDGFADLMLGAPGRNSGRGGAYVVYGTGDGFPQRLSLNSLRGEKGFFVSGIATGANAGFSVSSLGDFNGDGFDDLVVAAPFSNTSAGEVYVVFGGDDLPATIHATDLNGSNGFRVVGDQAGDSAGHSVSGGGDVNGDGFDDLIIGAPGQNNEAGAAYVIFGTDEKMLPSVALSSIDGTNGFRFDGDQGDRAGDSVGNTGDVNGDGFDDIVIAAPGGGRAFVIYGRNFSEVPGNVVGDEAANLVRGTGAAENLVGGQDDDRLRGNGGADSFRGGQGDDVLVVPDESFHRVAGGTGTDTLKIEADNDFDLTRIPNNRILGIERIDIRGSQTTTLRLNHAEVLNLSDESNTLAVLADPGEDTIEMGDGWSAAVREVIGEMEFDVYEQGNATLQILAADHSPRISLDNQSIKENVAGALVGHVDMTNPLGRDYELSVADNRFEIRDGNFFLAGDFHADHDAESSIPIEIIATNTETSEIANRQFFVLDILANPFPGHNAALPEDVNGDGQVIAQDALIIINYINSQGPKEISILQAEVDGNYFFYDVVPDRLVTPLDVLNVINRINSSLLNVSAEFERRSNNDVWSPLCQPNKDEPCFNSSINMMLKKRQSGALEEWCKFEDESLFSQHFCRFDPQSR